MPTISDKKQSARKAGFARRKLAHNSGAKAADIAASHLVQWLSDRHFSIVAGYIPIQTEINILPAMTQLHDMGMVLCVPVIIGKAQPLEFRQWTPDCDMESGPFGAAVPVNGDLLIPDLMLCPLVSFDAHGHRMGYGGGFYDRSLAEIRAAQPVTALGYAYADQKVDELPIESTDQPLDGVVTENGVTLSARQNPAQCLTV